MTTIYKANKIHIANIGVHSHPHHSEWLTTKDKSRLLQSTPDGYNMHRLERVYRNKYYYSKNVIMTTQLEFFYSYSYVTPTIPDNHIAALHTSTSQSVTLATIDSIRQQMCKTIVEARTSMSTGLSIMTSTIKRSSLPVILHQPGPRYDYNSPYHDQQYSKYREWWRQYRPIVPYTPSHNIAMMNFGVLPTGNITIEIEELFHTLWALPTQIRRTLGAIADVTGINKIAPAIELHPVLAVCDASINATNFGSHSYIIQTYDETGMVKGTGPVDCDEDDIESTRAEKAGVMSILYILHAIVEVWAVDTGDIVIYCDNSEATKVDEYPKHLQSYIRFMDKNYDLTEEIRFQKDTMTIGVQLCHIKGHQDDQKDFDYHNAPQAVRRNIDMDLDAKEFLQNPPKKLQPTRVTPTYTRSTATFKIHGSAMIGDISYNVRLHRDGPPMESRLHRKQIITTSKIPMVQ